MLVFTVGKHGNTRLCILADFTFHREKKYTFYIVTLSVKLLHYCGLLHFQTGHLQILGHFQEVVTLLAATLHDSAMFLKSLFISACKKSYIRTERHDRGSDFSITSTNTNFQGKGLHVIY